MKNEWKADIGITVVGHLVALHPRSMQASDFVFSFFFFFSLFRLLFFWLFYSICRRQTGNLLWHCIWYDACRTHNVYVVIVLQHDKYTTYNAALMLQPMGIFVAVSDFILGQSRIMWVCSVHSKTCAGDRDPITRNINGQWHLDNRNIVVADEFAWIHVKSLRLGLNDVQILECDRSAKVVANRIWYAESCACPIWCESAKASLRLVHMGGTFSHRMNVSPNVGRSFMSTMIALQRGNRIAAGPPTDQLHFATQINRTQRRTTQLQWHENWPVTSAFRAPRTIESVAWFFPHTSNCIVCFSLETNQRMNFCARQPTDASKCVRLFSPRSCYGCPAQCYTDIILRPISLSAAVLLLILFTFVSMIWFHLFCSSARLANISCDVDGGSWLTAPQTHTMSHRSHLIMNVVRITFHFETNRQLNRQDNT